MGRLWRYLRCPHARLQGVYGDEIIFVASWRRIQCIDCRRYLDLPLSILTTENR